MVEAIRQALDEILAALPKAVLLGTDIGAYGGPFRATAGLFEKYSGERVIDTPPNPAAILGFSRGLKIAGHLPICELPPELALRAAGVLIDGIGRYFDRTGEYGGPFVVRIPVGLVDNGTLSDGDSPEAALGTATGLRVVCPSRPVDAWAMLKAAAESAHEPVVVLEPKALYRAVGAPLVTSEVGADEVIDSLHRARRARPGSDLTIVTWGAGVPVSLEVAQRMTADGYEVGVMDMRVLNPMDLDTLAAAVTATGRAMVVHDAGGTVAGEVSRRLTEACFLNLEAPISLVSHAGAELAPNREDWTRRVRESALATLAF
jgi:pyruvate dehydrogenase E1 component beta subunit